MLHFKTRISYLGIEGISRYVELVFVLMCIFLFLSVSTKLDKKCMGINREKCIFVKLLKGYVIDSFHQERDTDLLFGNCTSQGHKKCFPFGSVHSTVQEKINLERNIQINIYFRSLSLSRPRPYQKLYYGKKIFFLILLCTKQGTIHYQHCSISCYISTSLFFM